MKEKISNFFADDKKRSVFTLVIVSILLVGAIIAAYYYTVYNNNEKTNTENTTTTTKATENNQFRGYKVKELTLKEYDLDYKSRYNIIYSNNSKDQIYTLVNDLELIYEVSLQDGKLVFDELRKDPSIGGEVYTKQKYYLELEKKIIKFIIGHNCTDYEYNILVIDEDSNLYSYENKIESNKSIQEIISSFIKLKTISASKNIGYYTGNNEHSLKCQQSTMIYVDKTNNIRLIDSKNTLFYNTAYYRYFDNPKDDTVLYVLKDKLIKLSNQNHYLNDGEKNIEYKGSFNDDKNLYIISKDNLLYKLSLEEPFNNSILKPINEDNIIKIGNRIIGDNNYVTNKNSLIIAFASGDIIKFTTAYDYELLG